MAVSERANKRRRLSKEPDQADITPSKAGRKAAEPKSTGRSTRARRDASNGEAGDASGTSAAEAAVKPASARRSARKSAIGATPNDNSAAVGAGVRPNVRPSPARGSKPQLKRDERILSTKKVDEHAETEDEGSDSSSDGDADEPVSRQAFLENEKAKRQREARNFVYSGDADAPKQTRSGRVVTSTSASVVPEDAPGNPSAAVAVEAPDTPSKIAAHISAGATRTPSRRAVVDSTAVTPSLLDLPTPTKATPAPAPAINVGPTVNGNGAGARGKKLGGKVRQLPEGAKPYLEQTMAILTGARDQAEDGPMAFDAEEGNETLKGLVNVLRGTVCRGEGNSALLVGPRGCGKTRTMNRALHLLNDPPAPIPPETSSSRGSPDVLDSIPHPAPPASSTLDDATSPPAPPIIVRLSGHAQTNDRLAIREMGRQIALAEGHVGYDDSVEDDEEQEYAPTTLPSHLLALLTAPSARAIVVVMEEFDLFTEHARQALLYCLLDNVQSIKTGPAESTGRGVALIGLTSRTDTLLLLEKRVKSRFSHRLMRVTSPLSPGGLTLADGEKAWQVLLKRALLPWLDPLNPISGKKAAEGDSGTKRWQSDWAFAVNMLLKQEKIVRHFDRLSGLTNDVRNLYRPFIPLIPLILSSTTDFLSVTALTTSLLAQIDGAGWGSANSKLQGLSQPTLTILVAAKHLNYAGKDEFNFAQVNEEYVRFTRTRLVGSGRGRWVEGILRRAFDQMINLGLLIPVSNATIRPHFARYRCTLSTYEIVAWFKGEGVNSLSPELGNWGRMMGGHA